MQEQGGCIHGAKIATVRDLAVMREATMPNLVRDFSGLSISKRIVCFCLILGQRPKRAASHGRIYSKCLKTSDERVATEDRHEPGKTGGWNNVTGGQDHP